ncbi:MAG TPA: hypothetical protein VGT78_07510 [Rhizomicrobium sp.]|nr:hypothetical protein [Rhizomicrobium sp.]
MARIFALGGVLLALAAGPVWADDCDAVMAAQARQYRTPYRAHSVMHHEGDDDLVIDAVNTADTRYVKMSGSLSNDWTHSPLDTAKDVAEYRHNMRQQKLSCHIERSEAVGGDMIDVYVTQDRGADAIKSRIWISRALGLPVKIETYTGQNTERQGISTATYEYNDVKPPIP